MALKAFFAINYQNGFTSGQIYVINILKNDQLIPDWCQENLSNKLSPFFHPARWDKYPSAMFHFNMWIDGKQAQGNYF